MNLATSAQEVQIWCKGFQQDSAAFGSGEVARAAVRKGSPRAQTLEGTSSSLPTLNIIL